LKINARRLRTLAALLILFAVVGSSVPLVSGEGDDLASSDNAAARGAGRKAGHNFFDSRTAGSGKARAAAERQRRKMNPARREKLSNLGQEMKAARERLAQSAADLDVQVAEELDAPEVVGVRRGRRGRFLTPASSESHEKVVRGFIGRNAALYGLTARQVAHLRKTAEYTNPEGNLSWVELQQEIGGVPVFQGSVRAMMTRGGELARTVGRLVPGLDDSEVIDAAAHATALSAAQAVAAGAASVGVELDPASLVLKESDPDGTSFVFERGPFDDDIKVELLYFPLEAGVVTPSWAMTLWQDVPAYYTLVDAEDGEVLWQKNITDEQTQSATYNVYEGDSPAPLSPSNVLPGMNIQAPAVPRTSVTTVREHPSNNLGWLTDGATTTTGNNVDAGLDIVSPNGIDSGGRPVSATRNFTYNFNPSPGLPGALGSTVYTDTNYRWGAVTNIFFWSNRYHDRLYQLGFTEAARNFQQDNFGRNPGGATTNARNGMDRVLAEAQDFSGTNNANFSTPTDGSSGRMQMFVWPNSGRDGDFDNEIVIHELTHGTSNRLHNNASGLGTVYGRGMGEGWSDFYARALLSSADEDVDGVYAMGAYATHLAAAGYTNSYYYGIRRFPYASMSNVGDNGRPHNPLTYADTNPNTIDVSDGAFARGPFGAGGRAGALAVHNIGEVWAMSLFEVRALMIKRLGYEAGNQRAMQIVTDGMKMDPVNPTLIDARDSLLAVAAAAFTPEDVQDIWAGFATRGMGFGATKPTTTNANTRESFDNPVPALGSVTFTDASCNANGLAEPGEDLTLSVPLHNPLGVTLVGVTATIGGETASYGDIAPGQTVARQLLYTVPEDCTDAVNVPVVVNSNLGQQAKSFSLRTAATPVVTFTQNFDGAAAPALPAGWSALTNPSTSPVWRTVSTSTQSAPNAAFVNFAAATSLSFLQSPAIAVNSDKARLTFRHSYNSEFEWDGGILQISLDGGATYLDILDSGAGARFVEGGYPFTLKSSAAPDSNTNLLASRAAWTGNSGGFITTTVQLPAAAAGKAVLFRWIAGADSLVTPSGNGWTIDNVALVDGYQCAPSNCAADLGVTQTVSPATVTTGSNLTYTINVSNGGPARATGVSVTDMIPAGTSFVSATAPQGWSAATPNVGQGGSVAFTKPSMAAGETAAFTLVLSADCGTMNGTVIGNTATVSGTRPDPNAANNSATATATADDPAPVVNAPANIVRPADAGQPTAVVTYAATTGDNCGGVNLVSSHPSGTAFPIGVTTVTLTATDSTGNVTARAFTVTVTDGQAPTLSGAAVDKPVLWSPNHQMVDINVSYLVADNSGNVATSLSVSSNEPPNGTADGNTSYDWQVVSNRLVRLRAERAGSGTGRLYTIAITARDHAGNTTVRTVTVSVPRSQS